MFDHERTVMRLQQMRVKARNASQAEALLSQLAIFQEPFGRSAIIGLAPKEMDESTRIAAFATLRSWNIIKQVNPKRFHIEESIRELFPPTDAIRLEQLNFFIGCVSVYDQIWAKLRWADLSSALEWGLKYQPSLGLELAQKIRHNAHFSSIHEHRMIMDAIFVAGSQQKDLAMQAYALHRLGELAPDSETAYEYYEQALAVYQTQEDHESQGDVLWLMGNLFRRKLQQAERYDLYKRALGCYETAKHHSKTVDMLKRLYKHTLETENVLDIQIYFDRLFLFLNANLQADHSYELARFMRWKKQYSAARRYFAQAYLIEEHVPIVDDWDTSNFVEILRDWGLMEYESGHQDQGYGLCHLALIKALERAERQEDQVAWHQLSHLAIVLQAAGCPDLPNYAIPMSV